MRIYKFYIGIAYLEYTAFFIAFKIHVTSKFIIFIKIKTSLKSAARCFKICWPLLKYDLRTLVKPSYSKNKRYCRPRKNLASSAGIS